jgi:16S rRNA (cytosine967-C5)-methyltransferase
LDSRSDAARAGRRASLAEELTACAAALRDTLSGSHLDAALARLLEKSPGGAEPAHESARAIRDMSYGAVRQLGRLRFLAERLNSRRTAPLLGALQLVALSQLLDGRRAPATVIDQAVAAAGKLPEGAGNRFSAGFINATLRRFERERASLLAAADLDRQAIHNHPDWWIDLVRQARPEDWQRVLAESLSHAPLTLRVNRRCTGAEAGARPAGDLVAAAGRRLAAAQVPNRRVGPEALVLERATTVARIPGFAEGAFTVQDAGAQLAAPLLRPEAGDRILDACAAPGGKTTHLLQLADCRVLALDRDASRTGRILENLRRENLPMHPDWPPAGWGAVVRTADATHPESWWDGERFDKILLDAPCSASGIVRRHPDVPWQRRRGDIATLARQQGLLLRALWPLLKPGGTLLYVTCSIFPDEGEGVTAAFCAHQEDCLREPAPTPWPEGQRLLSQLLPTSTDDRDHDGFFFALLSKQS